MLTVSALTKLYFDKVVFSDYDICLDQDRLLITGSNGQGKSTLFALLAGLESMQSGAIKLNGTEQSQAALQQKIAIASDKLIFPEFLTAEQVLDLTAKYCSCHNQTALIEKLGFAPYLSTRVDNLSSGNLKKLQLINAFMRQSEVLLLDEPTAALEHKSLSVLLSLIREYQGQVLLTCHEPDDFLAEGFKEQALNNV